MVKLEQELGKKRDNTKGTSSKPQNIQEKKKEHLKLDRTDLWGNK